MSVTPHLSSDPLPRHWTRTQELCGQLREIAQRLGPDARMPKLIELCEQFGASQHTLVRAIQELERQNVLYSVRSVGIFVKPQVRRDIRLLCDAHRFLSGNTPFWSILLEAARQRALSHREEFAVQPVIRSEEGMATVRKILSEEQRSGRVDAILAVGIDRELLDWVVEAGIPLASFAAYSPHRVVIDNQEMTRMGVEYLLSCGCQNLSLWMTPLYKEADEAGVATFRAPIEQAGRTVHSIRIAEAWPKDPPKTLMSRQEEGYKAALSLFSSANRPDGLLVLNDHLAYGVLIALDKLGLRAGRDVHIVTQSNAGSSMLLGREDQVASLEIDPAEIVEALFSMLEAQIERQPEVPSPVKIRPRLQLPQQEMGLTA